MNRGGPQARGIAAAGRVIASGAGGIAGGTVATGASARPRTSVRSAGVGTGDVRDARANAEAAIARDEVPPQRRGYVREYFRTVESMSRP